MEIHDARPDRFFHIPDPNHEGGRLQMCSENLGDECTVLRQGDSHISAHREHRHIFILSFEYRQGERQSVDRQPVDCQLHHRFRFLQLPTPCLLTTSGGG